MSAISWAAETFQARVGGLSMVHPVVGKISVQIGTAGPLAGSLIAARFGVPAVFVAMTPLFALGAWSLLLLPRAPRKEAIATPNRARYTSKKSRMNYLAIFAGLGTWKHAKRTNVLLFSDLLYSCSDRTDLAQNGMNNGTPGRDRRRYAPLGDAGWRGRTADLRQPGEWVHRRQGPTERQEICRRRRREPAIGAGGRERRR